MGDECEAQPAGRDKQANKSIVCSTLIHFIVVFSFNISTIYSRATTVPHTRSAKLGQKHKTQHKTKHENTHTHTHTHTTRNPNTFRVQKTMKEETKRKKKGKPNQKQTISAAHTHHHPFLCAQIEVHAKGRLAHASAHSRPGCCVNPPLDREARTWQGVG